MLPSKTGASSLISLSEDSSSGHDQALRQIQQDISSCACSLLCGKLVPRHASRQRRLRGNLTMDEQQAA